MYFIGWDVGGWNCDHNAKSRDAIVILDRRCAVVGKPWRGNLRAPINEAATSRQWIQALFALCAAPGPEAAAAVTLAIDTPLGFSDDLVALIARGQAISEIGESTSNRYLYRRTERFLFERGFRPLSAVKDMIGSQATKGLHVLAKFAPAVESCGVWSDLRNLRAIEAYPSASRGSASVRARLGRARSLGNDDLDDARVCAIVAYLFANDRARLEAPEDDVPASEGWIWFPRREAAH